jgi:hypothetical protein
MPRPRRQRPNAMAEDRAGRNAADLDGPASRRPFAREEGRAWLPECPTRPTCQTSGNTPNAMVRIVALPAPRAPRRTNSHVPVPPSAPSFFYLSIGGRERRTTLARHRVNTLPHKPNPTKVDSRYARTHEAPPDLLARPARRWPMESATPADLLATIDASDKSEARTWRNACSPSLSSLSPLQPGRWNPAAPRLPMSAKAENSGSNRRH